jgi:chromosome segregation ATPase
MHNSFDEIHEQIHEIRNLMGPYEFKLDELEDKISTNQRSFEAKISGLESKISEQAAEASKLTDRNTELLERISWIELALKVPQKPEKPPSPVHVDKMDPLEPGTSQIE